MLLYTEGWKKNLREQVTEPANACFQMRQEENLIIPMIKAIIRRKKGGKKLWPKNVSAGKHHSSICRGLLKELLSIRGALTDTHAWQNLHIYRTNSVQKCEPARVK